MSPLSQAIGFAKDHEFAVAALLLCLLCLPILLGTARWFRGCTVVLVMILVVLACSLWERWLSDLAPLQPPGIVFDQIAVSADAGRFPLGATALMQDPKLAGSASEPHIGFRQEGGAWLIANISATRRLSLRYDAPDGSGSEMDFLSSRFRLQPGDGLQLAGGDVLGPQIAFTEVGRNRLSFQLRQDLRLGGEPLVHTVAVENGASVVMVGESALPFCGTEPAHSRWSPLRWLRQFVSRPSEVTLLRFGGGGSSCLGRDAGSISVAGAPFGAASLIWQERLGFVLVAGADPAAVVLRGGRTLPLTSVEQPTVLRDIDGTTMRLASFVAGYTRYGVEWPDDPGSRLGFTIKSPENPHRVSAAEPSCNEAGSAFVPGDFGLKVIAQCDDVPALMPDWVYRAPDRRDMSLALIVGAGLSLALLGGSIVTRRLWRAMSGPMAMPIASRHLGRTEWIVRGLGFWTGWTILVYALIHPSEASGLRLSPMPPGVAIAAWGLAGFAVITARGAGLVDGIVFLLWTALVMCGHTGLVALSLSMQEMRYLRFADDATFCVAASAGIVIAASQLSPRFIAALLRSLVQRKPNSRRLPAGFGVLLILTVLVLGVWIAFGSETGIAGVLQPSEVIKSLTVLALAVAVTLAIDPERGIAFRQVGEPRSHVERRRAQGIAAAVFAGTLLVGAIGGLGLWSLAPACLALLLWVAVRGMRRDPFLRSFTLIASMLAAIVAVPVSRSDLSPFLILVTTSVSTLLVVLVVHFLARNSDRWLVPRQLLGPPADLTRPAFEPPLWRDRLLRWLRAFVGERLRRWVSRPKTWIMILPIGLVGLISWYSQVALADADGSRSSLIASLGYGFNTPVERFISWVEFNAASTGGGRVDIEFADVGLQVALSREAIGATECRGAGPAPAPGAVGASIAGSIGWAVEHSGRLGALLFGQNRCAGISETALARAIATRLPAIQSDFIGTWLIVLYGKQGAIFVAMLQWALSAMLVACGFLAMRWSPGQSLERPAASMAAYACIGFAIMMAIQWAVSWSNALGIVPVMGQPATFLSHGRSHFLFFGTPALLMAFFALRVRSAFETGVALGIDRSRDDIPRVPLSHMLRWLRPSWSGSRSGGR